MWYTWTFRRNTSIKRRKDRKQKEKQKYLVRANVSKAIESWKPCIALGGREKYLISYENYMTLLVSLDYHDTIDACFRHTINVFSQFWRNSDQTVRQIDRYTDSAADLLPMHDLMPCYISYNRIDEGDLSRLIPKRNHPFLKRSNHVLLVPCPHRIGNY